MKNNLKIKGKQIYLKQLNLKNATREYCSWLNDPEVNQYLETKKTTIEELKEYIRKKNKSRNCLFLGIFNKTCHKHIGNIKLEPIDLKNKKATVGILIGDKKYWGRGVGTEATKLLVEYAFNQLEIDEVNLGVISENKAAIKVYKKVGMEIINIEKKAVRHEGKLFDRVVMAIKKTRI